MRLVDHVNAFATLGRMGTYKPQTTILKVANSNGQTLKQYKESSKQVIDQQAAYIVSDILGDGKARAGLAGRDYLVNLGDDRSEERRVGKECRSRWSPYH